MPRDRCWPGHPHPRSWLLLVRRLGRDRLLAVLTGCQQGCARCLYTMPPAHSLRHTCLTRLLRQCGRVAAASCPRWMLRTPSSASTATARGGDFIAGYGVAHEDYTDDAAVMAAAGHPVDVIAGDPAAFKITTPADLRRAMTWDAAGDGSDIMNVDSDTFSRILNTVSADSSVSVPRVGTGVDSHAFAGEAEDVPLWVAGLHWPGHRGLSGHSDGDVAVHAICDALLAASGLGDLGSNFGTAEPQLRGAAGEYFLRETVARTRAAGYRIGNVSVQVVGNLPKVASRRVEAQELLASILGAPVNISATTTDGLGFTGRGEGIAAIATAVVCRSS